MSDIPGAVASRRALVKLDEGEGEVGGVDFVMRLDRAVVIICQPSSSPRRERESAGSGSRDDEKWVQLTVATVAPGSTDVVRALEAVGTDRRSALRIWLSRNQLKLPKSLKR